MQSNATLKANLAELRERQAREQRDRTPAVIAEFGGERRQPMLVPEDDPATPMLQRARHHCPLTIAMKP
jgi:hypothetical protein